MVVSANADAQFACGWVARAMIPLSASAEGDDILIGVDPLAEGIFVPGFEVRAERRPFLARFARFRGWVALGRVQATSTLRQRHEAALDRAKALAVGMLLRRPSSLLKDAW